MELELELELADLADEIKSSMVIGTDLSPIQPDMVPPNCQFYVDDVESDRVYGSSESFNFIHGRGMVGSIANYPLLWQRIYQHLKPGGWLEEQEYEVQGTFEILRCMFACCKQDII